MSCKNVGGLRFYNSLAHRFFEQPNEMMSTVLNLTSGFIYVQKIDLAFRFLIVEQRINELFLVKKLQIVNSLTYADVLDRDAELIRNANHHTTLCRAV